LSNTPDAQGWLRPRLRVAEAMVLLVLARLLIVAVPLRRWRGTLGRVAPAPEGTQITVVHRRVAGAVKRAGAWLPGDFVCLPRAMAGQWMLRRRGQPSALVFGVLPEHASGDEHALHAWVETGDAVLIGADPTRTYARGLTLVQP
jgi:hypothetical protein